MKKFRLKIGLLIVLLTSFSCSKSSDDNDLDPVFSQEYTKLQSLEEISSNIYYYAGIKVGDRKASMLIENSKSCRSHEYFSIMREARYEVLDFGFIKFKEDNEEGLGCIPTTSAFFLESQLIEEGQLFTTIREGIVSPIGDVVLYERVFKGILEIGFQGKYLRIEDRMSNYKREDPNEKVYLYFKKK